MFISRIKLKNWRNFLAAEAVLGDVNYVVGANASGKSNFLDVFRFLRDIAKPEGGGLQTAFADRGGLSKVRCLHARRHPEVKIEVEISEKFGDVTPVWKYVLAVKSEGTGHQRPAVAQEEVYKYEDGKEHNVLMRPDAADREDKERLTQTSLEQIQSNKNFREIAELLAETTYLHLVPQLIKHGDQIGGRQMDSDPFGQAFMQRIAKTPEKTRAIRLNRIQKALATAIPQFEEIKFAMDEGGRPHLEAKYTHFRPNGSWQREDQFSDGTLRLISLFWLLLDGDSMLLLEEPELSLDEEIVRQFPRMIDLLYRARAKKRRQTIISTHSSALLDNAAIDARYVLRLEHDREATVIRSPTKEETDLIRSGFTPAEVVLSKVHPKNADQLVLL
jgi:predicted ATPase